MVVATDLVVSWVLLPKCPLDGLTEVHLVVWSGLIGTMVSNWGVENHTIALTFISFFTTSSDWPSLTVIESSLSESGGVEMILGLDPCIIFSSELLLEILISIKIALSLLISDSWSAELLSTLIDTPVIVVLLGSFDWLFLGLEVGEV